MDSKTLTSVILLVVAVVIFGLYIARKNKRKKHQADEEF